MVSTVQNRRSARFMPGRPQRAPEANGKASFRSRRMWLDVVRSDVSRLAPRLLDLDRGPSLFELLLDRLRLVLGDPLLDVGGSRLDQVLGLLEAEAGDLADSLDDVDLLLARRLQDDVELGLLLDRSGSGGGATPGRHGDGGSRRGDAVVVLQRLDEVVELEHRQPVDLLDEFFGRDSHVLSL